MGRRDGEGLVSPSAQRAELLSDPTLAGRTVPVIEDHRDSREMLTQVFQSLRGHVITARNIEEAERNLAFHRPHRIICDMKLPDGTGLDFIKWLRDQRKPLATTRHVSPSPDSTLPSLRVPHLALTSTCGSRSMLIGSATWP